MLQDFSSVVDHFGKLCSKGLTPYLTLVFSITCSSKMTEPFFSEKHLMLLCLVPSDAGTHVSLILWIVYKGSSPNFYDFLMISGGIGV